MILRINTYIHIIFNVIVPIILGVMIYIKYRNINIIMFEWFDLFCIDNIIFYIRNHSYLSNVPFWFKYNFPDGLWVYSFTNLMILVWKNNINKSNIYFFYIISLIASSLEVAQLYRIIPGTYDLADILFYLLFGFLPFLFLSKK